MQVGVKRGRPVLPSRRSERGVLLVGLLGLQAMVEAAEQPVEQVAEGGGMGVAGGPPPLVVGSSAG
jgi:uncharacterized membrane protein